MENSRATWKRACPPTGCLLLQPPGSNRLLQAHLSGRENHTHFYGPFDACSMAGSTPRVKFPVVEIRLMHDRNRIAASNKPHQENRRRFELFSRLSCLRKKLRGLCKLGESSR